MMSNYSQKQTGVIDATKTLIQAKLNDDPSLKKDKKKIIDEVSSNLGKLADLMGVTFDSKESRIIVNSIIDDLYIFSEDSSIITSKEPFKEWYLDAKSESELYYWKKYSFHLSQQSGWTTALGGNISCLDRDTDKTLRLCSDPKDYASKARYGLVIGNVQSGKTSNYIGLICKASDVGYKVIIVITGILEDLRLQTQERIEEAFIGWDKSKKEFVGVKHNPTKRPKVFTTREDDFVKAAEKFAQDDLIHDKDGGPPLVFVIKKNYRVLKALNKWLKDQLHGNNSKFKKSLLVIDDEADNASINVSKKDDDKPSSINANIRSLLEKFASSTYVAYTATPFANIFISPLENSKDNLYGRDLFPRDFIQYIKPPSTYIGGTRLFVKQEFPDFVKYIPHYEVEGEHAKFPENHKKDHQLDDLPGSMVNAVNSFILSTAICWSKGDINKHSSMLINASRFTDVHESIKANVEDYILDLGRQIEFTPHAFDVQNPTLKVKELQILFDNDYHLVRNDSFVTLSEYILKVIKKIDVVCVNKNYAKQLSYDNVKYPNGRIIIAVGGMSLSRGLTLERLLVSYYSRTSKDYDTILQMGRWFGYREKYQSECRLFISNKNHNHYKFLAESFDDVCDEVSIMNRYGQTPMDFAVKVRVHPQAQLMVTARRKRGAAIKPTKTITYSGKLKQNYVVSSKESAIDANIRLYRSFIESTNPSSYEQIDSRHFAANGVDLVNITNFIQKYKYANHADSIQKRHLLNYIFEREHELINWYVVIEAKKGSTKSIFDFDENNFVGRQMYQVNDTIWFNTKGAVLGPRVIYNSLPKDIQAKILTAIGNEKDGRLSNLHIINCFRTPILVLTPARNTNSLGQNLITYSILMPNSNIDEPFEEVLVNGDVASYLNDYHDDEEEEDGDDAD